MCVSVRSLYMSLCFLPWGKSPNYCGESEDSENMVSHNLIGEASRGTLGRRSTWAWVWVLALTSTNSVALSFGFFNHKMGVIIFTLLSNCDD